ncbi:pentapeptide repeat-containing protein [Thalassovita aquimarina]|uniref:Pentapeptide repeat-containing protein n=1 Tax=Thalassovita aquimarina TaxID=2785917 RepID=A0ABS5HU82_9RHOB|nr:pentapeptide repeat-containing protein [Thalassovita aquimarina]MBR9652454.1 pentapeptide repeat-containing protein [Thalassovita aquimarina]
MTDREEDAHRSLPYWFVLADAQRSPTATRLRPAFAVGSLLLFALALAASVLILLRVIAFPAGIDAGSGIVVTGILAAPLLIWSAAVSRRALWVQQEGRITELISNAVELLATVKTVQTTGRDPRGVPVTIDQSVPNIEVRTGALLSLERIARDSVIHGRSRDHVRVMEILCAYIRENAPARDATDFPLPDWEPLPEQADDTMRRQHEMWRRARFSPQFDNNARDWAQSLRGPRVDIQMALDILARRNPAQRLAEAEWSTAPGAAPNWVFDTETYDALPDGDPAEAIPADAVKTFLRRLTGWREIIWAYPGYRIDLRRTNLQGADLAGALLCGARLEEARLEGAKLAGARLEGAHMDAARLEGANLFEARMEGARLFGARLEGAYLRRARLEGALLHEARMEGALLYRARMQGADLRDAHLEAADLGEARLEGAKLTGARLEGSSLFEAHMEVANLFEAHMDKASLFETRLQGADLRGARMAGAFITRARMDADTALSAANMQGAALREMDFSVVKIAAEQITSSFGDASVILPGHVTPGANDWPGHWPQWELPVGIADTNDFPTQWNAWRAGPEAYSPPPPPAA